MVGAVGLGPVGHFPEHLARIRGPELAHLGVNALAVRQDSRIALKVLLRNFVLVGVPSPRG
jgi:hypothetical protein